MIFGVDKRIKAAGFTLVTENPKENRTGLSYIRDVFKTDGAYWFTMRVDILHKRSGKHLIQAYQSGVSCPYGGRSCVVGLTAKEMGLFYAKMRQLVVKWTIRDWFEGVKARANA